MSIFTNRPASIRQEKHGQRSAARFNFILPALLLCGGAGFAQSDDTLPTPVALKKLSVEQLMDIEVTSVSRRPEKLSETASAIQVITSEDILRSGASSLPEALRLAPNLDVAQVNSHDWGISARGFNNTVANKLLVMMDGRTIYTPLYAGVFWDVQNVILEDIDRIEVVSGPGGTLWGANAVNGVINITTKSAKDTQGTLITGGGGSLLQDFGAVRYGDKISTNVFFRVYAQRFDRNNTLMANGNDATNSWDMTQGGFRLDGYPSEANAWTVQGDVYSGTEQGFAADTTLDGQNILGRWTHTISADSDWQVQAYFDRTWRRTPNSFTEDLKTFDVDFQHRFPLGERQSVIWGGGYRLMVDEVVNSAALAFLPPNRNLELFSGFVQDEITLLPERLKLTLGTKLEHNDYSGVEVQPSGRIAWTPDDRQTVWAAISRAVRSPSRIDSDFYIPANPPYVLAGGTNFDSEKLLAYEVGYRVRPTDQLSVSLAAFYNQYDQLRSVNEITTTNFFLANDFEGETAGVELSANFQATSWWRWRGGYTYLYKSLQPTSPNANPSVREGNDPEHHFLLQSIMDLPGHFQFDTTARYVDLRPSPVIPSYFTVDLRLAWQFKNLELAVVGQNLCDNRHPEFGTQEIPRSVFGKVTWRF